MKALEKTRKKLPFIAAALSFLNKSHQNQTKSPPGRVNENREPCMCKAVSYQALYCSQRPAFTVKTSQLREKEGGLQTMPELYFGLLLRIVGFYARSSRERQAKPCRFFSSLISYRNQLRPRRRNRSPERKDRQNSRLRRQTRRHRR